MNQIIINIPIRAKSIQDRKIVRMGKFSRLIKSKESMAYEENVSQLLIPFKKEMALFKESFTEETDALFVTVSLSFDNFYTKENKINSRIPDVDNSLKSIFDCILNKSIGIDDKFVKVCHVEKKQGNDSISLAIKIISK